MPTVKRDLRLRNIPAMIHWTSMLLKFCRDHNHAPVFLSRLEECIAALKDRNIEKALDIFNGLRRAGMGSFLDWFPPAVHPAETEDYANAVFGSLFGSWVQAMERALHQ
jgi:hypothetical protein